MKKILLLLITCHLSLLSASAQCGIENTAFKSGESLSYDLYFNWQFIWVKVGSAEMDTNLTTFEGKEAWKSYLITRGNNKLDKYFMMRDTLLSYCNPDLSPLYFRKGAREGSRYYVDEIWYSYPNSFCQLKKHRIDADGEQHWKTSTYKACIYDMMSIFLRARNFDASKLKKGATGISGLHSRRTRGDRHSSRVEAKKPGLLSSRDGYLLELTGWTQGSQAS